jgi:diguanylate cyclase (GGDEF)-like protein
MEGVARADRLWVNTVRATRDPVTRVLMHAAGWSKWTHLTVSGALVLTLGLIDTLTGAQTSLAVFHLLPLAMVAWFVSRRWAVGLAAVAGFCWFIDARTTVGEGAPGVMVWACASRVGFFMLVVWLVSALRELYEQQRALATTDELTGVANRRAFIEAARRESGRASRADSALSVLYLDCDHFKLVNDRLGHATGDRLLRQVAQTLEGACRRSDVVARIGGDEFAVLLPDTAEPAASRVAGKIRNVLAIAMEAHDWPVTFSIGVATFARPPADPEELLRRADALQYAAKHGGRNAIMHATMAA